MYVVTFYSYKGGVGRTMALVNIATEMAKRGRKVLLVDFDLEAPGLSSYEFCGSASGPGIVDYIRSYSEKGVPPDISSYVQKCNVPALGGRGEIWIMSAGRQDDLYRSNFQGIDWADLYENRSGYLMIENMKEQWKGAVAPDYVFVDSRTGYTDVSGICTRQLPDAVVVTFFPNKQNLSGLVQVVKEIRGEGTGARQKNIALHFVASNTPDVDDEHGILRKQLDLFQKALGYEDCNVVHYYNNVSLVDQAIFTVERPNTKLAREYCEVLTAIIRENSADREGALAYLNKVQRRYIRRLGRALDLPTLDPRLQEISQLHSMDGEVLAELAQVSLMLGRNKDALTQYENAIGTNYSGADAFRNLAFLYTQFDRKSDAVRVLTEQLRRSDTTPIDAYSALQKIVELDKDALADVLKTPGIRDREPADKLMLIDELRSDTRLLPFAMEMLNELQAHQNIPEKIARWVHHASYMTEIGLGRFEDAMAHIGRRSQLLESGGIVDVFNFAMAEWGATRSAPKDLFARVRALGNVGATQTGANFAQCMVIACVTSGDVRGAKTWLAKAKEIAGERQNQRTEFSCWRYLNVSMKEFAADLDEMGTFLDGEEIVPLHMRRTSLRTVH